MSNNRLAKLDLLNEHINKVDPADVYTADFETTSVKNLEAHGRVRVYLWSLTNIKTKAVYTGYDIVSFFAEVRRLRAQRVYFHNLDFDGQFILYYLLENNLYHDYNTKLLCPQNTIFEIRHVFSPWHRVDFRCSYRKSAMGVMNLALMLGMEPKLSQLADDGKQFWDRVIPDPYTPTQAEIEYCKHDSYITAVYMEREYEAGRTRLTLAGESWNACIDYINGGLNRGLPYTPFKKTYPELDYFRDAFVRKAYRGGICMVKPEHQGQVLEDVWVLDVRAMYPYVMTNRELPKGPGLELDYEPSGLYVVKFTTAFEVKDGYPPTIQLKGSSRFGASEYIRESNGDVELTLTNLDYRRFKEHYHVFWEYGHEYVAFESNPAGTSKLAEFIQHQVDQRAQYPKDKNPYLNKVYKDTANMTYGSFGLNPMLDVTTPEIDKRGLIKFIGEKELNKGRYIPVAVFITAHAREKMWSAIMDNYDNWVYTDTDSIHLLADARGLDIGHELGQWEYEGVSLEPYTPWPRAKYLRPKTYVFGNEDRQIYKNKDKYGRIKTSVTCAGMTDEMKTNLDFDKFEIGAKIPGKRMRKRCIGGCVITEGVFSIHDTGH